MPWLLSLVSNCKGEIKSRVDIFDSEVANQITIEDLDYFVLSDNDIVDQVKDDVKKFVKKAKTWSSKKNNTLPEMKKPGTKPLTLDDIAWGVDWENAESGDDEYDILDALENPKDALADPYWRAKLKMQFGEEVIDELQELADCEVLNVSY